jgi:formylmethanofuran dehydrogenase subunit E
MATELSLQHVLEQSAARHSHLCPRQVLGVRIGLADAGALNLDVPRHDTHASSLSAGTRLLIIIETDGCFADGIEAATGCTIGHRTLRVEDFGKIAATFVDVKTQQAVRVAPRLNVRERACTCATDEPRHYFAQLKAYQVLPAYELFSIQRIQLTTSIDAIVSRAGVRVNCELCGEEIVNEREVVRDGLTLCRSCAGQGYYRLIADFGTISIESSVLASVT